MAFDPDVDRPTTDRAARLTAPTVAHGSRVPAAHLRRAVTLRPPWEARYAAGVVVADVLAVAVVAAVGVALELGAAGMRISELHLPIAPVAVALSLASLFLTRAWEPAVLGQGSEEFSRVVRATASSAVTLGLVGLAAVAQAVRPWVFGLIPAAGLASMVGRWLLRRWLHRRRTSGSCVHHVLAVGTAESVVELVDRTRRDVHNGWVVTAACTPSGAGPDGKLTIKGVPVVGDLDAVRGVVGQGLHRVVSVSPAPGWTSRRLHQLAWDLEEIGAELVVDPGLMEVAGPRLHVAPVDGLPLLRLTHPTFTGVPRAVKAAVDYVGAIVLVALLLPFMLAVAVAVKLDGGPVFYRQLRVGRNGTTFPMIKFRSMVVDADTQRAVLAARNESDGPLFKMRSDPRVTRVGAWLRRYSVDELPQLFNVVTGSMSLVGPRPPLPTEVETYERDARRKFMVKPGLTGLWQVSGRSNLSWEQSVRLDLRYVENWSLAQDALILWKTVGAVVKRTGAY